VQTGASKHYAFIEFAHKEVAAIVAKAMHGYLMFSKILVCQVVPPEEVNPNTFKNSSKPFRKINWVARERERHNKVRAMHDGLHL
jgi:nucleolar protein 15